MFQIVSDVNKKILSSAHSNELVTPVKERAGAGVRLPKIDGFRNRAVASCNQSPELSKEAEKQFVPTKYSSFQNKPHSFLSRLKSNFRSS